MKKIVRLNENELTSLIRRVISEISDHTRNLYISWAKNKSGDYDKALHYLEDYFKFRDRLPKKDFAQYDSATELENEILKLKKGIQDKEKESNATKIYDDKNILVIAANTWEASCKYAAGTKWCTGAKDTSQYWKRHNTTGTEFIWINKNLDKKNPNYKLSFHIKFDGGEDWCDAVNQCSQISPYDRYNDLKFENYDEVRNLCLKFHDVRSKDKGYTLSEEFLSLLWKKIIDFIHSPDFKNSNVYNMTNVEYIKQWFENEFDERDIDIYDMVMGALEDDSDDSDDLDFDISERANEIAMNVSDKFFEDINLHIEAFPSYNISYDLFRNIYQYITRNGNDERVVKFVEEFTASPTYEKLNEMTYIFEREMDAEETISENMREFVGDRLFDMVQDELINIKY